MNPTAYTIALCLLIVFSPVYGDEILPVRVAVKVKSENHGDAVILESCVRKQLRHLDNVVVVSNDPDMTVEYNLLRIGNDGFYAASVATTMPPVALIAGFTALTSRTKGDTKKIAAMMQSIAINTKTLIGHRAATGGLSYICEASVAAIDVQEIEAVRNIRQQWATSRRR